MRLHLSEHDPPIDEVTGAPLLDFENYCCGNVLIFARSFALFLGQLRGDTCFPLEEPLPTKRILLSEDPTPLTLFSLLFFHYNRDDHYWWLFLGFVNDTTVPHRPCLPSTLLLITCCAYLSFCWSSQGPMAFPLSLYVLPLSFFRSVDH